MKKLLYCVFFLASYLYPMAKKDTFDKTPLFMALVKFVASNEEYDQELKKVSQEDRVETFLNIACRTARGARSFLKMYPTVVDEKDCKGNSVLLRIIADDRISYKFIEYFLNCSINCLDCKSSDGETPLLFATKINDYSCVEILLKRGANLSLDTQGVTPLQLVVIRLIQLLNRPFLNKHTADYTIIDTGEADLYKLYWDFLDLYIKHNKNYGTNDKQLQRKKYDLQFLIDQTKNTNYGQKLGEKYDWYKELVYYSKDCDRYGETLEAYFGINF